MKQYWAHETANVQKGVKIGEGTKVWNFSQVLQGARVGKNCVIGHNCLISSKAKIGNNVKLESNTDVWDLVVLEDFVFVGPSAVFTNDKNPRAKYPKAKYPEYGKWLPTVVREGATIGANATVVCGTTIGKWAMVGAGAVVAKDVPDYAIALGVPATVVGWVCECGNKVTFLKGKAACKICQRKYQKNDYAVSRS